MTKDGKTSCLKKETEKKIKGTDNELLETIYDELLINDSWKGSYPENVVLDGNIILRVK